jgi:uncharacterized protein DUF4337
MDIDPMESAAGAAEESASKARLSTLVAITVALLATFLGVCNVKDGNIVQAMQQAQVEKLDNWSFYQARNTREEVGKAVLVQLKLAAAEAPPAEKPSYREAIAGYEALIKDQTEKKEELRIMAEQDEKAYNEFNYRDDQFDLSDTLIALAISLLAMTALTHKRWLFAVAMVPTLFGLLMGLAGLLGWHLHSNIIAQLLS